MESIYFGNTAGFFYPAPGTRGVVIASSWGFEDLCAHRALCSLAEDVAAAGCPALRVDFYGTGDSGGSPDDAELVSRWINDICNAARWLQTHCGVQEIVVVGLRLGALIAIEASRRMEMCRVALLAPPATGRGFLRELKALARVIDSGLPASGNDGGLELAGFRMTAKMVADIEPMRLAGPVPCDRLLIVDPASNPNLGAGLALGAKAVDRMPFEGYDVLMCDPSDGIVPRVLVREIADWCCLGAPASHDAQPDPVHHTMLMGAGYVDEIVPFEDGRCGILCHGDVAREVLIIVNAGGLRRIGWGRMWVDVARALAPEGIATFRFDLSYLDAPAAGSAETKPGFYDDRFRHEIAHAIDALAARGYTKFGVAGLCSGAYHALRATRADIRISRVMLINQMRYWSVGESDAPLSTWIRTKAVKVAGRVLPVAAIPTVPERIVKAVRGFAEVLRAGTTRLSEAFDALASHWRHRDDVHQDVAAWFRTLAQRNVDVDIVLSLDGLASKEFQKHLGPNGERLWSNPNVRVTVLPDTDHLLTPRRARANLINLFRSERFRSAIDRAA